MLHTGALAQAEELRVAYTNYPPFAYTEEGKASGITIDLIRAVCQRLQIEPVFTHRPFARLLYDLRNGAVDCGANVFWAADREAYVYYTPFSSIYEEMVVYVNRSTSVLPKSLDDLLGKKVGAVRGYHYGEGVLAKFKKNVVFVKDSHTLFKMLAEGRFDVALGNRYAGNAILEELGIKDQVGGAFALAREPFFIAFSKKLDKRGEELASAFAREIERIDQEKGEEFSDQ